MININMDVPVEVVQKVEVQQNNQLLALVPESMYDKIRRLYIEGRLTDAQLLNAVAYRWITEDERLQIIEDKKQAQGQA